MILHSAGHGARSTALLPPLRRRDYSTAQNKTGDRGTGASPVNAQNRQISSVGWLIAAASQAIIFQRLQYPLTPFQAQAVDVDENAAAS